MNDDGIALTSVSHPHRPIPWWKHWPALIWRRARHGSPYEDLIIRVTHDPSLDRRYVSSNPGTFGTPGISRPKEWWQIEATRLANEDRAKTITHIRDGDGDD